MSQCKQKIHASEDQIFTYLSNLQNIVDIYKNKVSITTVKDLGNACYGKKYQYEVEKKHNSKLGKQAFTVEITEYQPYETIAWMVTFDRKKIESKNTIYIPTTLNLKCKLISKNKYTLVLLSYDFEYESSLMLKLFFKAVIRSFQHKICQVLVDIRNDIEQSG